MVTVVTVLHCCPNNETCICVFQAWASSRTMRSLTMLWQECGSRRTATPPYGGIRSMMGETVASVYSTEEEVTKIGGMLIEDCLPFSLCWCIAVYFSVPLPPLDQWNRGAESLFSVFRFVRRKRHLQKCPSRSPH